MPGARARMLPDNERLHLHHGPIDLIVEAFGPQRYAAYQDAVARFGSILDELVAELPQLRKPGKAKSQFSGAVAQRMQRAIAPYCRDFVTPMAAVAGAVADEILHYMTARHDIGKAYVNNGGDAAFHVSAGEEIVAAIAAMPGGRITVRASEPCRGIATSGWRGRSFSLGIADAVSVVARNAADADVAATLIANAVDLPGHPNISRKPAIELSPDSDLGGRNVTTGVGDLTGDEIQRALDNGMQLAQSFIDRELICGAYAQLRGEFVHSDAASGEPHSKSSGKRKLIHA